MEHVLLLQALKVNGMSQSDVTLVGTATDKTPQTLASGKVSADRRVVSDLRPGAQAGGRLEKTVHQRGREGFDLRRDRGQSRPATRAHKEEWTKIAAIYYKCVAYLKDPDDARMTP